jgi:hypothetical protein
VVEGEFGAGTGDVPAGLVAELMVAVAQQDEGVDPCAWGLEISGVSTLGVSCDGVGTRSIHHSSESALPDASEV